MQLVSQGKAQHCSQRIVAAIAGPQHTGGEGGRGGSTSSPAWREREGGTHHTIYHLPLSSTW